VARSVALLLVGAVFAGGVAGAPKAQRLVGEYKFVRIDYVVIDCKTGMHHKLSMEPAMFAEFFRKITQAGAKPSDTVMIDIEVTPLYMDDYPYTYAVNKINDVKRGSCGGA
jgi:hypothetical protein